MSLENLRQRTGAKILAHSMAKEESIRAEIPTESQELQGYLHIVNERAGLKKKPSNQHGDMKDKNLIYFHLGSKRA